MASAVKTPVNAELLRRAREEHGLSLEEAAHVVGVKPVRLTEWEQGDGQPTVNQVRNLATLYHRTIAFFLLRDASAAAHPHRPTDFRGRGDDDDSLGPPLAREVARSRIRRRHFIQLQGAQAHRLPDAEDVLDNPARAATALREVLGINIERQVGFAGDNEARQAWTEAIERLNVLVFQMSRVDPDVCRGFSIYEDEFPVIMLNGAESHSGRMFTLFHETAHLLSRTSALCDVWKGSYVEWRCNLFAGELLLPERDFREQVRMAQDPVAELARRYNVSQSGVAVRLRSLDLISQEELDERLAIAKERARAKRDEERSRERSGGPQPHILKLRNLSPRYVSTVLEAMHEDEISIVDAAQYLESKVPTLNKMEAELERRGLET